MNLNAEQMYKMCLHKRKYKTQNKASEYAKKFTEKSGVEHRVYLCPLCLYYHLTTKQI